jgi:hypothetical protein
MVKDLKVIFGNGPGNQPIPNGPDKCAPMWKKKSIFWELPYWEVHEVRSAIDVMHVTKNLCVHILGFLGLYGSQKIHRKYGRTRNIIKEEMACIQGSFKGVPATLLPRKRRKSSLKSFSISRSRLASHRI